MKDDISAQPKGHVGSSTVDPREIAQFDAMAATWWDTDGPMAPLHRMNPLRLRYIRDHIAARFARDVEAPRALDGLTVLDIGCGGGLLCEPVARLGAAVTGIDASTRNIAVARAHAAKTGLDIAYHNVTVDDIVAAGENFDAVLCLEIVEHVADFSAFARAAAACVAPGGIAIASTLNRTAKAFGMAIVGAEYVLRWLPRGTHKWSKFVKPAEFAGALTRAGLLVDEIQGMAFNPLANHWHLSADVGVNYLIAASRPSLSRV